MCCLKVAKFTQCFHSWGKTVPIKNSLHKSSHSIKTVFKNFYCNHQNQKVACSICIRAQLLSLTCTVQWDNPIYLIHWNMKFVHTVGGPLIMFRSLSRNAFLILVALSTHCFFCLSGETYNSRNTIQCLVNTAYNYRFKTYFVCPHMYSSRLLFWHSLQTISYCNHIEWAAKMLDSGTYVHATERLGSSVTLDRFVLTIFAIFIIRPNG